MNLNQINKFFNKELRTLIFFVTTKCPLRCKHCFYNTNRDVKELTLKEIEKIASNLSHLETVQFSGGEPFVRKDLPKIIEIFVKKGVKRIGIPTNGYFTEATIAHIKKIKKLKVDLNVSVSIDGFRDLHNQIRGRDCWDRAIETFKKLKENKVKTGFNVALSKLNYDSCIDFIKFLKKLSPDYITPIIVRAKPDIMLSAEEFKKIRPEIERLTFYDKTPFYKKRQKLLNDIFYTILKDGGELPFKCFAGKIIAVLEPDGQVRSCEIFKELGNIRDYNYDIKELLKKDKIPRRCKNCIHPCFLGPSMSYSLKWMAKHILSKKV